MCGGHGDSEAEELISLAPWMPPEQGGRQCMEAGPKAEGLAVDSGAEREEGGGLGKVNRDGKC